MSLYLANCTKQHLKLNIRLPEHNRISVFEIPSGQQLDISAGLSKASLDHIVRYIESKGFRNNTDGKLHNFDGFLYSLDKPMTSEKIYLAHDALVEKQERRSVDEAMKNALGFEKATRGKQGKRLAKQTEVEVIQDIPPREKPTGDEVHFKVTVDEKGTDKVNI